MEGPTLTAQVANNTVVLAEILKLSVPVGAAVLDMTYGKGAFWQGIDRSQYALTTNAPPDCALCPRLAASRRAVVNGVGPIPARIMVVAQNPGREEEIKGEPLVGWSGQKLDYLAGLAGIGPGSYRKENVCRCRPPRGPKGDLPLKPAEISNCAPFLDAVIIACQPEFIVTLGAPAFRWFFPLLSLTEYHGRVLPWKHPDTNDTITVVPMYHPAAAAPNRNPSLAAVMIEDWTRLGELLRGRPQGTLGQYQIATTEQVRSFLAGLKAGDTLAFDYETTDPRWRKTFQPVRARPIGISFAVNTGAAIYWPIADDAMYLFISLLKPTLENPDVIKVAHNASFEYIVSRQCQITPVNLHCTKLMAYVLRASSTGLKDLSWNEFGVKQTRHGEVDWDDLDQVVQYGSADSDLTFRLYKKLGARLEQQGLWPLYELERAALPALAEMTIRGISFHPAPLVALGERLTAAVAEREAELRAAFGVTDEVNLNSDHQLRELLYGPPYWRCRMERELKGRLLKAEREEGVRTGAQSVIRWIPPGRGWPVKARTDGGAPAVDMDTLRLYTGEPIVGDLVFIKSARQALENNITRLPQLVQEDGRIHPTFHQAGQWEEKAGEAREAPVTGRTSSSGPNLQNVTHHGDSARPYVATWAKEIRRGFVASPGMVLVKADIGQEEPRIGAFLAQDDELLAELENGDVYCPVASLEFGRTITKLDTDERQIGKRGWMAWLNGAGPAGIQQSAFWLTTEQAGKVVKYLQNRHPRVEAYRASLVSHLHEHGYTSTHFGRRIYRPAVWSGLGSARSHAERSVMPDAIQGTAADVMKIWLSRLARELAGVPEAGAHLLLTIHDEVVLECRPDWVGRVVSACTASLSGILPVRLPAEVWVGPNWNDMERV